MKKLAIGLLLSSVCICAAADWNRLGEASGRTFYFDPAKIQKSGTTAKMHYLVNVNNGADASVYASYIDLSEYDCLSQKWRALHITEYTGSMGSGEVKLSMDSKLPWEAVKPGTIAWTLWNVACASK